MSESTVEVVRAALLANAQVSSAVAGRIYPMRLPQNVDMPAIVLGEVAEPSNTMGGANESALTTTRLQVDVYSKSYMQAASVASLVDGVLAKLRKPELTAWREVSRDLFDDELDLHRRSMDFSVWR